MQVHHLLVHTTIHKYVILLRTTAKYAFVICLWLILVLLYYTFDLVLHPNLCRPLPIYFRFNKLFLAPTLPVQVTLHFRWLLSRHKFPYIWCWYWQNTRLWYPTGLVSDGSSSLINSIVDYRFHLLVSRIILSFV